MIDKCNGKQIQGSKKDITDNIMVDKCKITYNDIEMRIQTNAKTNKFNGRKIKRPVNTNKGRLIRN